MVVLPTPLLLLFVACPVLNSQGFPLISHSHSHPNPSDESIERLVRARNLDIGIFDFKKVMALVDTRSKLYDETIRLSNVFPGQTRTVPVPMRSKNRLGGSSFSWDCDYCGMDDIEYLQFPSYENRNVSTTPLSKEPDSVTQINSMQKMEGADSVSVDTLENVENDTNDAMKLSSAHPIDLNVTTPFMPKNEATFLMKEAYEYIWNSLFASSEDDNMSGDLAIGTESVEYYEQNLESRVSLSYENLEVIEQQNIESKLPQSFENLEVIELQKNDLHSQQEETVSIYENSNTVMELWNVQETIDLAKENSFLNSSFEDGIGKSVSEGTLDEITSKERDFTVDYVKDSESSLEISSDDFSTDSRNNEDVVILNVEGVSSYDNLDVILTAVKFEESQPSFPLIIDEVNQSTLDEPVKLSASIEPTVMKREELVSLTFSVVRLQLLVTSMAATIFLSFILILRLYQFVTFYPMDLVFWLNEECERSFRTSEFEKLASMLTYYLPRVEWLFGLRDLETIALVHYLARSQMALGRYGEALQNLEKLLSILQPYGEDEYMGSILEDCGFVLHALGRHSEAIQCLHKALRIISEEQVCQYECEYGQDFKANQFVNEENRNFDNEDHDRLVAADDATIVAEMNPGSMDFVGGKLSNFEVGGELATSNSPSSSSLLRSFDSPSTQDLNEAFYVHSNLTTAVKELEAMLEDDAAHLRRQYRSAELASWRQDDDSLDSSSLARDASTVFNDFIAVPSVEVARLCKKLGEIYRDNGEYAEARLFFQNAVSVAMRINFNYSMESDIAELEIAIAQIAKIVDASGLNENIRGQSFDTYNRFLVGDHP